MTSPRCAAGESLYFLSVFGTSEFPARHFKCGDIIFFDNFTCSVDEYHACEFFVKAFRVNYEVLGAVGEYSRVCVKLL